MNPYSTATSRLVTVLTDGLTALDYDPLTVFAGVWKPRTLPAFERFLVQVAPPTQNVWTERRISTKEVQHVLRFDIFLLVKNYGEDESVFGETAPDAGVFQMTYDVKDILRGTNLGGLLSRTYNETMGDVAFESGAATGFDTGPRAWVHRARVPYTAECEPFCFPPS